MHATIPQELPVVTQIILLNQPQSKPSLKFVYQYDSHGCKCRGGVEDTRLEAKAKDTKKIRGQGQPFRGQNLSRPRTEMLGTKAKDQEHRRKCSPKKKGLQKFFSGDLQFIGVPRIFDWDMAST